MNARTLTNYYAWGIKLLLFVIPFLSLWISTSMFFPYITGRNFGFRILIEIALVLWVGLIILNKDYRPRATSILWTLLFFVAVVGVANLLGVDPYHSFWSRFERMEGYLMILHLAAYFLMLTTVFRAKKDWLVFFNLFLIAGVLVGFYGVLQKLGLKEAIQGGEERIDGTIGNPTYLAAYLLLILTLGLVLLFNSQKKWQKIFYSAVIAFDLLIIYFTATRGVIIALLAAFPLFLIGYLILFRKDETERKYRKWAAAALVAIIAIPFVFLLIKNQPWVRDHQVLSRFAGLSLYDKTVRSRFMIWGISWEGFKERPILGWGQENYLRVFSKHYDSGLYDQEPWFDRSHNIVFDWLINAGILGLISYVALFVFLIVAVIDALRGGLVDKKEGLVLIIAPIAYFVQNLFVFDNSNTYILFFGLLAYVNNLSQFSNNIAPTRSVIGGKDVKNSMVGVIPAVILSILAIYFVNVVPILQAKGIIASLVATTDKADPIGATLKSFQKTLAYDTFGNAETLEQLARVSKSLVDQKEVPTEIKLRFAQFAVTELEKYLERFPADIRMHLFIADLYQSLSSYNAQFLMKARDHFKITLELSPAKQQIYFVLANNYLVNGEVEKTLELLEKAIKLEPSNPAAHTNRAIVAIAIEKNDIVQQELSQLTEIWKAAEAKNEPNALGIYAEQLERIGNMFISYSQFGNARIIFEKLAELVPQSKPFVKILEEIRGK